MKNIKPEISLILPSIRVERLEGLYNSIKKSTKREFELVIVGPYNIPNSLFDLTNIKFVKDHGSPMRASNIAAELCEGKLVSWLSDDCLFFENSLDNSINDLYSMGENDKNVIIAKYYEGEGYSGNNSQNDTYYKLNHAYPFSPYIPDDWWIFNVAIMYRSFFDYLGGWNCQFQTCPLGHADFGVRAQRAGAVVKMTSSPIFTCDHMPGTSGDHAPIHYTQHGEDEPLYKIMYSRPLNSYPTCIDISNWKNSSIIWDKRFGNLL